jgi:site-specific recombinase XerC
MPTVALSELSTSWARYLRSERKSERTVRLYADAVTYLGRWLVDTGRTATLDALTREALVDYLDHSAATVATGTALTRFKHLRAFCSFLVAEGEVNVSPMAGLKPPYVPEHPVAVLSDEEIRKLLKAAAALPDPFTARRDEAMVRLLADAGVRISELCSMQAAALDLDGGTVWVTGKGDRRRLVMFGARTTRALDRYVRARRGHRHAPSPALWLTQRGAMSKDAADERLRVLSAAAGVEGVHAHRFRHTWADDWLSAGGGAGPQAAGRLAVGRDARPVRCQPRRRPRPRGAPPAGTRGPAVIRAHRSDRRGT